MSNPENANTQVYKDKYDNDNCYRFKAEEVNCPANKSLIKIYLIVIKILIYFFIFFFKYMKTNIFKIE